MREGNGRRFACFHHNMACYYDVNVTKKLALSDVF
jgi:hypothetical protein